jgi:hypothetical protein
MNKEFALPFINEETKLAKKQQSKREKKFHSKHCVLQVWFPVSI